VYDGDLFQITSSNCQVATNMCYTLCLLLLLSCCSRCKRRAL